MSKTKLSKSSQRSQLTNYIANTLKSRQVTLPLIDIYIDCAKAEPLHLKNNTIKERFMIIFNGPLHVKRDGKTNW